MLRRDFIRTLTTAALLPASGGWTWAGQLPTDVTITRVVGFTMWSRRPKMIGKNAFRDVHGDHAREAMLRVYTSAGIDGLGRYFGDEEQAMALLGRSLHQLLLHEGSRVSGVVDRSFSMSLWDLAGKLLGQPVWQLLGGAEPVPIPVYDGSIYFADLLPEHRSTWRERFRREIDDGWARGHRFFKVKIGRGHRWMGRTAGDERDVEVVREIARHGGNDIQIAVDANNGYDPDGAERFLERASDVELAFVEEMFPETIEDCLRLKEFIASLGRATLLADGESARVLDDIRPFIQAGAFDLAQPNMNRFGVQGIFEAAALARAHGIRIAPHNWGSITGFYQQLHVAQMIANFYRAEQDPAEPDLVIADGYQVRDGLASVSDAPGFGLTVSEERFREVEITFDRWIDSGRAGEEGAWAAPEQARGHPGEVVRGFDKDLSRK